MEERKIRTPSKNATAAFRRQQYDERLTFVFRYIDSDHDNLVTLEGMGQLQDIELDYEEISTVLRRLGVPESVFNPPKPVTEPPNDVGVIPAIRVRPIPVCAAIRVGSIDRAFLAAGYDLGN